MVIAFVIKSAARMVHVKAPDPVNSVVRLRVGDALRGPVSILQVMQAGTNLILRLFRAVRVHRIHGLKGNQL